jgi:protein O-mannosyl-transferase
MTSQRARGAALWLCATLLPIALYAPSWRYGFVYDDLPLLVQNPALAHADSIPTYFARDLDALWRGSSAVESNYYRPLFMLLAFGLRRLCASDPALWHIAATLLFGLTSLLAMAVLRSHGLTTGMALMGALLFAAHPAHVDSVAWVSGLQDLLVGLLGLAGWLTYRRWQERPGGLWLGALTLLYALSLLAKETGIGLLLAVLATEAWDGRRAARTGRPALLAAMAAVTAAYLLLRWSVLGSLARPFPGAPDWPRALASVPLVFATYLRALLWPADLALLSPLRPVASVFSAPALIGALAALAFVGLAAWLVKRQPAHAPGIVWFCAWLLPCLNLWAVNPEWIVMDRYLFLPALALPWLLLTRAGHVRKALATVLLLFFVGVSLVRMRAFANETTFWTRQLEVDSTSSVAWTEVARLQLARGDPATARESLTRASALDPRAALPRLRLGILELAQGHAAEATEIFLQLTRANPGYVAAWHNLPVALSRAHRSAEALVAARDAQARFPADPDVAITLCTLLRETGQQAEALAVIDAARARSPYDARLLLRQALLLAEAGRVREARGLLAQSSDLIADAALRGQLDALVRQLDALAR